MSTHRAPVRPRYGRLAAAGSSLSVTVVAVLAGFGLVPTSAEEPTGRGGVRPAAEGSADPSPEPAPEVLGEQTQAPDDADLSTPGENRRVTAADLLPDNSGEGRRAVFSQEQQRVWIIGDDGEVQRSYLVSGSTYDNLDPGAYNVYSRSMNAVGIEDSGTMKYFVRFTQGDTGAAIGFHDIPVSDGEKVQSVDELGEPTSHGCIRQKHSDAKAMWKFAQLGTSVVVTD